MNCECENKDCPYCYPSRVVIKFPPDTSSSYYFKVSDKQPVTKGVLDNAIRRALNILDAWNNCTGVFEVHSSYYFEIQSVIEDAVHCGIQAALNEYDALESEIDVALQDIVPFPESN